MRSSAGEHLVDIEGVTGSIPVASTIFFSFQISRHQGWLAFALEQPSLIRRPDGRVRHQAAAAKLGRGGEGDVDVAS